MPTGHESSFWAMNVGEGSNSLVDQPDEGRSWEDCVKYGFLAMGGGERWIENAGKPAVGEYVFAYLNRCGFVGYGEIVERAVPFKAFRPSGQVASLMDLPLTAAVQRHRMLDSSIWDMCIGIRWIATRDRSSGVKGIPLYPRTLCRVRKHDILQKLIESFRPSVAAE